MRAEYDLCGDDLHVIQAVGRHFQEVLQFDQSHALDVLGRFVVTDIFQPSLPQRAWLWICGNFEYFAHGFWRHTVLLAWLNQA